MKKKFIKADICVALIPYFGKTANYYYVTMRDVKTGEEQSYVIPKRCTEIELNTDIWKCIEIIPAYEPEDIGKMRDLVIEVEINSSFGSN